MTAIPKENSPQIITSVNPAQGYKVLGEVVASTEEDVRNAVAAAQKAQPTWWRMGLKKRLRVLEKLAQVFKEHREDLIRRPMAEMGAPEDLATGLALRAEEAFRWNLDNAQSALADEVLYEDSKQINLLRREPYGVMACIVAWNFPYPNFIQSVTQALIAGNTVVMKYSEEIVLFGKFMEELCQKAGLPQGILQFVHGGGCVGAWLAEADVNIISFTGSYTTGQKLYEMAAKKFIPIINELGGSNPGLVFKDADVKGLAKTLFWLRFQNTGQFCSNLKRLIVHEDVFEECAQSLVTYAKTVKIGDPQEKGVQLGPMIAERQVEFLEGQLQDAVQKGAKILCGGGRPETLKGAYFEPTVLINITQDMRIWKEEVFGPILPIVSFETYEEAIALANDTPYGLGAFVFTQDKTIIDTALRDIKAGGVSVMGVNNMLAMCPFGGQKRSGLGRTRGTLGFHDVTQTKTIGLPR